MPPIGIPKDDLPKSGPQLYMIVIFTVLLIGFSVIITVLVMNGIKKKACSVQAAAVCAAAGGTGAAPAVRIDPQEFIATFEVDLGKIKKVDNNLFTVTRDEVALDTKKEGSTELRTYVKWDRPEGMDANMIWATVSFVKLEEGKDPTVTRVEALMHATEMFVADGVSLMFDPVSDTEVLFTLDTNQFWANQHPGGSRK